MQTYRWTEDAIKAIREHFTARNMARGRQSKRVVLRKKFVDLLSSGDAVHSYTYGGETVTMTNRAYDVQVSCGC